MRRGDVPDGQSFQPPIVFNFMDPLDSISGVDTEKLFTLSKVDRRLEELRESMMPDAAAFLLPAADAARDALRAVQEEFVLRVDADRILIGLGGASPIPMSAAAKKIPQAVT